MLAFQLSFSMLFINSFLNDLKMLLFNPFILKKLSNSAKNNKFLYILYLLLFNNIFFDNQN